MGALPINCETWKTPYAKTTNDGNGLLTPEQRTTPMVGAKPDPAESIGNMVSVDFQPIGANMSCQLRYRATDGTPLQCP